MNGVSYYSLELIIIYQSYDTGAKLDELVPGCYHDDDDASDQCEEDPAEETHPYEIFLFIGPDDQGNVNTDADSRAPSPIYL
jgi:hypothetical protein